MPQVPPVIDLDGEDIDGDSMTISPPHHIWNALIPPDSLSVTGLLIQFPDHSSSTRPTLSFHPSPPTHFTSPDDAGLDLTLAIIQTSPLPEKSAIRRIREGLESTQASEFQSLHISLGSVNGLFPFWFAKCLTQMEVAERSARLWRASLRWLQRGESDPAEAQARSQCVTRLNTLGWYTPLEQFRSAVLHGTDLAGFLGDNWLTDEHMNAAGDWINMRLGEDSHSRVLSTFFLGSLALNRSRHPTWNPIRPRKLDTLVRDGHVLFLMIPVHLHCHWTYLYVDLINRSCIYFDSLDPDNFIAPDGVLELLDWWLASVLPLPEEEGLSEEDTRNFDATEQTDGHSCGIAVLSIMAHVALGEESWTQEVSRLHRERWFLRLSEGLPVAMSGCFPTDNSPSAPPPAFDFDLEETLETDFNPIVCSVSSQPRQPSLPPPEVTQERNPTLSPSPSPTTTSLKARPSTFASPPKVTTSTAALPTGPLQQSKLNFPAIDRKKWLEVEKEKSRRSQEEREAAKERARRHILWQQEERKRYERERKQDYRKRKVEEEVSSGVRFPNGKKRKTALVRLQYPASSTLCNHSMPDATRPYREIRAHDHSKTKHTCGRKSKRTARSARRMRWLNRLVFGHIDTVARQVGYPFSPKEIVRRLQQQFPDLFATLLPQRISDWRDPNFPDRLVWRPFVTDALAKGDVPKKNPSRKYILDDYPHVILAIRKNLKAMRQTGIPLDLNTIRGLMIALITRDAPEVFKRETAKGRLFQCSPSFVRRFIRQKLRWSFRRATKAAQKTPKDAQELTRRAFLRMACTVRDEDIPAALIVNADQTQVILAQGTKASYAETNSKQVAVVGQTEKRAFTLMISVSQSGDALPFQAIYTGKDPQRSLPKPTSPAYSELVSLGHRFEVSKTSTYWATQETMRYYVIHIAAPYFRRKINELKLPGNQRCILYLDVWSVHRSAEFRSWLRKMYPWILLQYCPGGCTSLFQPCDANINRLAKEAIRRAALEDIIKETTAFLEAGISPESIALDKSIGTLRNRTPGWLLAAWKAVNQGDHVLKSWELCATGDFNLSHQSLTSRSARQAILDLRSADPEFYAEITSGSQESLKENAVYQEDEEMSETGDDGSSSSSDSEDDFFESEDEIWPKEAEDVDGDAIMVS